MKPSLEKARVDAAPDVVSDPFLFDLNWSAQELTDAMCRSLASLHHFVSVPSANDAAMHRPRRRTSYVAIAPLPARFRIGG
ncbi:MAG: hypothetical protein ABL934_09325 [Lysobacteraceae bacterium]